MKNMLISGCILASAIFCLAETNKAYVTSVDFLTDRRFLEKAPHGKWLVTQKAIESAKKIKECLPSDQFSEGNWGAIEKGFQVSVRFDKARFTNGEPLCAILLLRNTSQTDLEYWGLIDGKPSPADYVVRDATGKTLKSKYVPSGIHTSSPRYSLLMNSQRKYTEDISKFYDFTNGVFTIQALFKVKDPATDAFFWLKSGEAKIEVSGQ